MVGGRGPHHVHIFSLFVTSRANKLLMGKAPPLDVAATAMGTSNDGKEAKTPQDKPEMLAIAGDLTRSISVVQ
jgi:hypothetical protein